MKVRDAAISQEVQEKTNSGKNSAGHGQCGPQWTKITDRRININCALGRRLCTKLSTDEEPASWPKPPSGASPDRHPATCIVPKRTQTPNGEIWPHIALADPFLRMQSSEIVLRTSVILRKIRIFFKLKNI